MNSLIQLFKILLIIKLANGLILKRAQHDIIQDLNKMAFSTLGVRYPFHVLDSAIMNHKKTSSASIDISDKTVVSKISRNLTTESHVENLNASKVFDLKYYFQLVSLKIVKNTTDLTESSFRDDLDTLEELIKHSVLRFLSPNCDSLSVQLERAIRNDTTVKSDGGISTNDFPVILNMTIKSPVKISAEELESALVESAINREECQFSKNESLIKCFLFKPKNKLSLLRIGDYWIEFHHLKELLKAESQKQAEEVFIFKYNNTWVVGLAIIGGVISLFFIGCIIAICYTRRPYRRSGKVYEIESSSKNKKSAKVPQIPGIHPSTKASALTKNKELYY